MVTLNFLKNHALFSDDIGASQSHRNPHITGPMQTDPTEEVRMTYPYDGGFTQALDTVGAGKIPRLRELD